MDFGLDEPIGINETAHLHDGVVGPNVTTKIAMDLCGSTPIFDPRQKDSTAADILQPGAELFQCRNGDLKARRA
jgi:hypothetical protein